MGVETSTESMTRKTSTLDITPAEIIKGLAEVNEKLQLPHSIHLHCNDLGHPGNYETTLASFDVPKNIKPNPATGSRDTVLYATYSSTAMEEQHGGLRIRGTEDCRLR